jgi:hypothetical protein
MQNPGSHAGVFVWGRANDIYSCHSGARISREPGIHNPCISI